MKTVWKLASVLKRTATWDYLVSRSLT